MQALHQRQIKKMLLIKSKNISQNPIIFHEVWITNSKWSAPPIPPGSQRRRREIKILSNSAFFSRQGAVFFNHDFMKIRVNSVLFNSSKKMSFYLSLKQVVFILSNSASFFTRRRSVPRPWNFFLSWIRAQTTPVFTTNCTILFPNFTADCTISDKQQTAVLP